MWISTTVVSASLFEYTTEYGGLTIIGYAGPGGAVTIPDTIDGLAVTGIGWEAFYGNTFVTSIAIPASVTSILGSALRNCPNLAAIEVAPLNPAFSSVEGVLFNQNQSALLQCPLGKRGSYVLPNTVTSIGDWAFTDCGNLAEVVIPSSVTAIGDIAFRSCTGLTKIGVPASVVSIGEQAFDDCTNLSTIDVDPMNTAFSSPDGVLFNKDQTVLIRFPSRKAGNYIIPNSTTNIEVGAFSGSTGITGVVMPSGLEGIQAGAFQGLSNLTNVVIPNTVTYIGGGAFAGCQSLLEVYIPEGVAFLGRDVFRGCASLLAFTVDPGNAFFSSADGALLNKSQTSFIQCPGGKAGSYTIPASVLRLSAHQFAGCAGLTAIHVDPANTSFSSLDGVLFNKDLTSLIRCPEGRSGNYTIPDGATWIGRAAFLDCARLANIAMPESVTVIDWVAFGGCTGLTNVRIPKGVTTIQPLAYRGCTNLTDIYFLGNPPIVGSIGADLATVYYLPGTSGWGALFGGRPAVLWNPLLHTRGVQNGGFRLEVTGTAEIPIVVEAGTDTMSRDWFEVYSGTLTDGSLDLTDMDWTEYQVRFYRVRSPSP